MQALELFCITNSSDAPFLYNASSLNQPDDQRNERKHQQQMDRSTKGVIVDHSKKPHQQENEKNGKHGCSSVESIRMLPALQIERHQSRFLSRGKATA
jgi:hypothetical protein